MSRILLPRSSFALELVLVLTACSGQPEDLVDDRVAALAVGGNGVSVNVVPTQVWTRGFTAAVRITDHAFSAPIFSFQVVFKLVGSATVVGSGSNGVISRPDASGKVIASNPAWLPAIRIQHGQIWDVYFNANGAFSGATVLGVTINGQTIPISGNPHAPPVSLTSSATTVTAAGSITLTVDPGPRIVGVDFFEGSSPLGAVTAPPFTLTLPLIAADNGIHCYTATGIDAMDNSGTSTPLCITVDIPPTTTVFRVNSQGRITRNGQVFSVRCGSWSGLEGHDPSSGRIGSTGAPIELYIGNTNWANGAAGTGLTIQATMTELVARGINMVRLPVVPQTLDANEPQGRLPFLDNYWSVRVDNARLALEQFIQTAARNNIQVLLDMHSCSNYVHWRKGRLDARPPYVDRDRDDYEFKRESYSCAATDNPSSVKTIHPYNETLWLNDLKTLAGLGQQLGVDNIIGIDIFNEPWDYTWAEWKTLTEHAFQAIDSVNPNTLLFVQGVSGTAGNQDGTPDTIIQVPFGNPAINPSWGENLYEAGANPPDVPKDRLVFSPHTYGPSVVVQKQFMDPAQPQCAAMEGDAAGNARCNIVIDPALLRIGWEEHFGYLKQMGYAVVVGEFGGNLDWPAGQADIRDRNRWGYIAPGTDAQWQDAFVSYMVDKGMDACYWAINPESHDRAGWHAQAFDPVTNVAGWGEWLGFDARKSALLNRLWGR
jgi:endoglucanase